MFAIVTDHPPAAQAVHVDIASVSEYDLHNRGYVSDSQASMLVEVKKAYPAVQFVHSLLPKLL